MKPSVGISRGVSRVADGALRKQSETKNLRKARSNRAQSFVTMTASPSILVVEDDRETRALIARYLRTNAFQVATAADGREMDRALAGKPRRPHHSRRDAAGRGWLEPVPQAAPGVITADHHADGARRGRRPHPRPRDGRRRLSAKAVQSARTAGAHQGGAAAPGGGADRERIRRREGAAVPRLAARSWLARAAQSARRARRADQRRVRPAAGACASVPAGCCRATACST